MTVSYLESGYAAVAVGRRRGYLRQQAVGIPLTEEAQDDSGEHDEDDGYEEEDDEDDTPPSKYGGASLVATTLVVLGWIIAGVGLFGAVGYAVSYDCKNATDFGVSDACAHEGWIRFSLFVGTLLTSWLVAVVVLWFAYVLRLLSDIEGWLSEAND